MTTHAEPPGAEPGAAPPAPPARPPGAPPASPARGSRGRRWLLLGTLAWCLLLIAAAIGSFHSDQPTVREQRSIAQASPVVDRALGELTAAARAPDTVLQISGRRVTPGCRLTSARDGATLERSLTVRAAEARVPAVLDQIADRLPASFRAGVRHRADGVHRIRADAGEFVAITGGVTSPGVLVVTVKTGCRPQSPGFDAGAGQSARHGTLVAENTLRLIGASGIAAGGQAVAPCPTGEARFATVTAIGQGVLGTREREKLTGLPDARVLMDSPTEFAVGTERASVHLKIEDGRLTVAVTDIEGDCPARAP